MRNSGSLKTSLLGIMAMAAAQSFGESHAQGFPSFKQIASANGHINTRRDSGVE
jgi:hypothetical protein